VFYVDEENKIDIPVGISNSWVYMQKKIIFEAKLELVSAFSKFYKVYVRQQENDALFQDCIMKIRQIYLEIKGTAIKNKKVKKHSSKTMEFLEEISRNPDYKFEHDDFPMLYNHYVEILDILCYIGLTDIEMKNEDPSQAIMSTDS